MKTLAALAQKLMQPLPTDCDGNTPIQDCWRDARQVQPSGVFIAMPGVATHGYRFIAQALQKQAACVLLDPEGLTNLELADFEQQMVQAKVAYFICCNLAQKLPGLVDWFYDSPSQKLAVVGITGTNGKTSTAHFCAQLLYGLGKKVAVMGTLGNGVWGHLSPSQNTTLETVALQRHLADYCAQGVEVVVIEVSSHALALGRIAGIRFHAVGLTQVTRDHLDFHATVESYLAEKRKLFTDYDSKYKIVNLDDSLGKALAATLPVLSYSKSTKADLQAENWQLSTQGLTGQMRAANQTHDFASPLLGEFNLDNILCAISLVSSFGFDLATILPWVSSLKSVAGRMQLVHQHPAVMVDYAHTPDALASVLKSLKPHLHSAKLWLVFGCGGDRDKGKRPLMGQVAEGYADHIVLTDDNPRYEKPSEIIQMIQQGLKRPALVVHDRVKAIHYALTQAKSKDLILIAGKGHEDYQEIKGVRWPMQDSHIVAQWVAQTNTTLEQ